MARSVEEIYDSIIQEKEAKTTLDGLLPDNETSDQLMNDLSSGSKVAIWRLWAWVIAYAHYLHEVLFDEFIKTVDQKAKEAPAGTPRWYRNEMLKYQHGDNLVYKDNRYVYDPVDESKRIIDLCAVQERPDGVVAIKLAKDNSGTAEPLTTAERDAAEGYANKIKFAGTRMVVISADADQLTIVYDLYYDPIIPLQDVQDGCQAAADDFLDNLPFNGAFNITQFTDALQTVEGVTDPIFQSAEALTFAGNTITFDLEFIAAAGYFEFSDTLEVMFNWIPKT